MRIVITTAFICWSISALAVGDPPRQLDRREAAMAWAAVRPLLVNDDATCPSGQTPLSGEVSGGSAPGSGSQTTVIAFDRGAVVRIARNWDRNSEGQLTSSAQISCIVNAETTMFDPRSVPKTHKTARERCLEAVASLRISRNGACDRIRD